MLDQLETGYGRTFEIRHCAASAAVLNYPCTHMDMVRPGIALYGHYPAPSCEGLDGPGLKPVMALYSRVAAVRAGYSARPAYVDRVLSFSHGAAAFIPGFPEKPEWTAPSRSASD